VELLVFAIIPIAALSEMVNPTLKAFMSNEISEKDQGILQGVLNSIVGFTSVIGPISMSYIFSIGASKDSLIYSPGAPIFICWMFIFCFSDLNKAIFNLDVLAQFEYRPS